MNTKHVKRFTVSLELEDYERLRDLGENHRPRLSLQYVVEYAVRLLLDKAQEPQVGFDLGDPFKKRV